MGSYPYTRLDADRKEIRLLELEPGSPEDTVRCKLTTTTLDDAPSYEALSYTWEDPEMTQTKAVIAVGGHTMEVTANLESALRHLQQPSSIWPSPAEDRPSLPHRLWVDALCLNQADNDEKNQQVPRMYAIYSCASRVLVWLGEGRENSNEAMDLLSSIHRGQLPDTGAPFGDAEWSRLSDWIAVEKLLQRRWWRRMWVVQELAASKGCALVGCGNSWLPWSAFATLPEFLAECAQYPFFQARRTLLADYKLITKLEEVVALSNSDYTNGFQRLLQLLQATRSRQATDRRDKVFALLGLVPSISVAPDYSMSEEEVCIKLTKTFLEKENNLSVLFQNQFTKRLNLPTWVPDWTCDPPDEVCNAEIPEGSYSAVGNIIPEELNGSCFSFSDNAEIPAAISVYGGPVDHVFHVFDVCASAPRFTGPTLMDICDFYKRGMQAIDSASSLFWRQDRADAFWRTLVWNASAESGYPAPDSWRDYCDRWLNTCTYILPPDAASMGLSYIPEGGPLLMRVADENAPYGPYYKSLLKYGLNRRFFVTLNGRIGMGPRHMRERDDIYILVGSKVPVVLRGPKLLGPAYVHGIMEEEALWNIVNGDGVLRPAKIELR